MKKNSVLFQKLIFTAIVLIIYTIGRCISLYGVDVAHYYDTGLNPEMILLQTIAGDKYQYSLFALGISPYMIASMTVALFVQILRSGGNQKKVSQRTMNQSIVFGTIGVAIFQAIVRANQLVYLDTTYSIIWTKLFCIIEMVTGAAVLLWLTERNKRYGIGAQTVLIYINIVDRVIAILKGRSFEQLWFPLVFAVIALFVIVLFENTEFRIPVQRISIHNIYSDKNYLAIKLTPIGIMPIMFASAFFMLPQLLVNGLLMLFPNNTSVVWWHENLVLNRPLGVVVYVLSIYFLTIAFSMIMINPKDITENFLKSGDSFIDIYPGKKTRRYLQKTLIWTSLFGATIMSLFVAIPLILQFRAEFDMELLMFPTTVMMITGLWCNLFREVRAIRSFDQYIPFFRSI